MHKKAIADCITCIGSGQYKGYICFSCDGKGYQEVEPDFDLHKHAEEMEAWIKDQEDA